MHCDRFRSESERKAQKATVFTVTAKLLLIMYNVDESAKGKREEENACQLGASFFFFFLQRVERFSEKEKKPSRGIC